MRFRCAVLCHPSRATKSPATSGAVQQGSLDPRNKRRAEPNSTLRSCVNHRPSSGRIAAGRAPVALLEWTDTVEIIPSGRRPIGERGRMGKGNTKNLVLFVAVCMLIIFGWNYLEKTFWPPPKPTPKQVRKDVRKYIGFMGGAVAVAPLATSEEATKADGIDEFHKAAKAQADAKPKPPPKPVAPKPNPEFVELGNKDFFLQVRLTNIGAAVDRVILTHFKHADEMGLWDKTHDRLNLIRSAGDR